MLKRLHNASCVLRFRMKCGVGTTMKIRFSFQKSLPARYKVEDLETLPPDTIYGLFSRHGVVRVYACSNDGQPDIICVELFFPKFLRKGPEEILAGFVDYILSDFYSVAVEKEDFGVLITDIACRFLMRAYNRETEWDLFSTYPFQAGTDLDIVLESGWH